jgi:pseudouridine-5'-monophosphatase
MLGRRALQAADWLVAELGMPISGEEFLSEREPVINALFQSALPMPGAPELTQQLTALGIPHAVASSSSRRTFEIKTAAHAGWFAGFDTVVLGDDPEVHEGKPAPDIFLVAAQRMRARPEQCLVVEDSPAGIAAGRAAGMAVLAVPDPNMDPALFTSADHVIASLRDFDPEVWGMPAFQAVANLEAAGS